MDTKLECVVDVESTVDIMVCAEERWLPMSEVNDRVSIRA